VKKLFLDANLSEKLASGGYEFSSANSINTGRLIPQIVYYFYAYSQLAKSGMAHGTPVNFVVPTGNFGNILAGYYAKQMGLPVNNLICASNENKVLFDYFETGTFDSNRPFFVTSSPSMDILVPSNFERLVHALDGSVAKLENLSAKQKFTMEIPKGFAGYYASENETRAAIKKVFAEHNYLIDPHTAVAYAAYEKYAKPNEKTVIVSTASPYKFAKTVMCSVDEKYAQYDDFALLGQMAELTKGKIPAQFDGLEHKEILHKNAIEIAEMKSTVLQTLNI
jgi:threonine synthase